MPPPTDSLAVGAGDSRFATTQWSLVLRARSDDVDVARTALVALCERYWYSLYAHIRGRVGSPEDAADLTQGFFAHLLESDLLASVDSSRGKLRAFLLACCNHYLSNERDKARAAKRGGGRAPLSLDFTSADVRYAREPASDLAPERLFERRWALALLDEALAASNTCTLSMARATCTGR